MKAQTGKWFVQAQSVSSSLTFNGNTHYLKYNASQQFYSFTSNAANNAQLIVKVQLYAAPDTINPIVTLDTLTAGNTVYFSYLTISNNYYLKVSKFSNGCANCNTMQYALSPIVNPPPSIAAIIPFYNPRLYTNLDNCNMVYNGNFDLNTGMPTAANQLALSNGWANFGVGFATADYYNGSSANVGVPANNIGNQADNSTTNNSTGYAGFVTRVTTSPGFREGFQTHLTRPMINNKVYYAELFASLAERSQFASGNIEIGFGNVNAPINGATISSGPNPIVINSNTWRRINGTFTANAALAAQTYLFVRNFKTDAQTPLVNSNNTGANLLPFAYYYIDDVRLQRLSYAGPNQTICFGQDAELGTCDLTYLNPPPFPPPALPIVTYSWSPIAGLSDPTSANPIANPTVTTDYVLTVNYYGTNPYTIIATDTSHVRVTVLTPQALPPIINAGINNACGFRTYTVNLSTLPAQPLTGGSLGPPQVLATYVPYNFSWNIPSGAVSMSQIVANPNAIPPTYTCSITLNWTSNLYGGNITYNYTPPGTGNCVITSQPFVVPPCCTSIQSAPSTINVSASAPSNFFVPFFTSGTQNIDNKTFVCTGDINVPTCTFNNCKFLMQANSNLFIDCPEDVTFNNCIIKPCNQMWQGIRFISPSSGNSVLTLNNTTIEDAYDGIRLEGPNTLIVKNSFFRRNYRAIRIRNYTDLGFSSIAYVKITGTLFDGTSPLISNQYAVSGNPNGNWGGAAPYLTASLDGVELEVSKNVKIGLTNEPYNNFNGFKNINAGGIYANASNVISLNNNFTNCYNGINGNLSYTPAMASSYIGIDQNLTPASCNFTHCTYGINTVGPSLNPIAEYRIAYNTFYDIAVNNAVSNSAINANLISAANWYINDNNIQYARNGISVNMNNLNTGRILDNVLDNPCPTCYSTPTSSPVGISANNCNATLKISGTALGNQSITGFCTGISASTCPKLNCNTNQILIPNYANTGISAINIGIRVFGCANATLKNNEVSGFSTHPRNVGYQLENCLTPIVCNNDANVGNQRQLGYAFKFMTNPMTNPQGNATIQGNNIRNCYRGFYLYNLNSSTAAAGPLGVQGGTYFAHCNTWNNMLPLPSNYAPVGLQDYTAHLVAQGFTGNANNRWSLRNMGSLTYPSPFINGNLSNLFPIQIVTAAPTSLCAVCAGPPAPAPPGGGEAATTTQSSYLDIIEDAETIATIAEKLYISKDLLYEMLMTDSIPDTLINFTDFKDSVFNGNYGKIYNYKNDIRYEMPSAEANTRLAELNAMQTDLENEALYKEVLSYTLMTDRLVAEKFTSTQIARLREISYYCPLRFGNAVFLARNILNTIGLQSNDVYADCELYPEVNNNSNRKANNFGDDTEEGTVVKKKTKKFNNRLLNKKITIYPNPANDYIIISGIKNLGNVLVEISNFSGQLISTTKYMNALNQIQYNTSQLANGVYNVKIIDDENGVIVYKLTILK